MVTLYMEAEKFPMTFVWGLKSPDVNISLSISDDARIVVSLKDREWPDLVMQTAIDPIKSKYFAETLLAQYSASHNR